MGSDEWETDAWKEGQKKEQERVKKANDKRKRKAKKVLIDYLMDGCSYDTAKDNANELLPKIIEALEWKGEEVSGYYK